VYRRSFPSFEAPSARAIRNSAKSVPAAFRFEPRDTAIELERTTARTREDYVRVRELYMYIHVRELYMYMYTHPVEIQNTA
jgi:hypothetical protein